MYIDFHTHVFPTKVAKAAIPKLTEVNQVEPSTDGTRADLLRSMEQAGIALSIVLPVMTDSHQFDSIIKYADFINSQTYRDDCRLLSFGGIHPECTDINAKLALIKEYGFKGIKLHPDYQHCNFNDLRYKRILYRAAELGLICVTHTGWDPYSSTEIHCTPEMILENLEDVSPEKLVLAHMGNNENYDKVEQLLVGRNVYFDTAYSIKHMQPEQMARIIHAHGSDKVLFASDAPWSDQAEDIQIFRSLPLTLEEKEAIAWKNASALL